jgi:hypothetical protein
LPFPLWEILIDPVGAPDRRGESPDGKSKKTIAPE